MTFDYPDSRTQGNHRRRKSKGSEVATEQSRRAAFDSDLRSSHLLTTAQEMAVYAKSIQVDDSSQRSYVRYCDDFTEPEVYIDEKGSNSEYDFKKSLHAFSVDFENVKGMEELAASSYIGDIVATGSYQGMQQSESAILATALTSSTLVFVESSLHVEDVEPLSHLKVEFPLSGNKVSPSAATATTPTPTTTAANAGATLHKASSYNLPTNSSRSSSFSEYITSLLVTPNKTDFRMSPDERVPAMQKEQSLINKRASTQYSVELSEQSKMKVEEIWQANTNFAQVGLEEEIQSCLNKYMYSQHIYGQEVDPDRLAKR